MTAPRILKPSLLAWAAATALATLSACGGLPTANPRLEQARSDYRQAQDNPHAQAMAGPELKQAGDALDKADAAWSRKDAPGEVDHWAYLATQRVAIVQETVRQREAEQTVAQANATRDSMRLTARTAEADASQRQANASQQQAMASQRLAAASLRLSDASQRDAAVAQQQAEAAKRDAEASQRQSDESARQAGMAQQQTADAQARNQALETRLTDMAAKKTDRGMVVTIGDVLFDTGRAELKAGGARNIDKLAAFLVAYPQRKAMVEGYTDSVGGDGANQALSDRRANAVRAALTAAGIAPDRIAVRGYGEAYPVAGNDSAGGRQSNRRVEVLLSDESGTISAR